MLSQSQAFDFQNCSTLSEDQRNASVFHSISCNIEDELCENLSNSSMPPEPYIFEEPYKPWFLYNDSQNVNYQRIGVNITWGPSHVQSIKYLQGFSVALQNRSGIFVHDVKYFCIHDQLSYHKHIFAKFSYEWFGNTTDVRFYPGQHLTVSVQSLPAASSNTKKVDFKIPNFCSNSKMGRVYECIELKTFNVSVVELSCSKRVVKVYYVVPSFYGRTAILGLTELLSSSESRRLGTWTNLPLNGSFELPFNSDHNVRSRYVVFVKGDADETNKSVNIDQCPQDSTVIAVSIPIGICILILIIILMYYWFAEPKPKPDQTTPSNSIESKLINVANNEKTVKVFVVYSADHAGHKKVILSFVEFLQGDLGFHVISELHESANIFKDYSGWIEKSLTEADKVLVIWSPNAAKKWNHYKNCTDQKNAVENDLFSPVVMHVRQKLLCHRDSGKYIFGYFEYCSESDIPKEFFDDFYPQLHCRYKLMENFEKLYFRLKGEQQFIPDATKKLPKVESKRYMDKNLNKFGNELFNNIQEMCDYVSKKPLWHEEKPVAETRILFGNSDIEGCGIKYNQLMIAPLPTENDNSDALKVQNTFCEETGLSDKAILIDTDLPAKQAEKDSLDSSESTFEFQSKKNKSNKNCSEESVQTAFNIENGESSSQCDNYDLHNGSIDASMSAQPLLPHSLTLEEGSKTLDSGYTSSSKEGYQDDVKAFELAPVIDNDDDAMEVLMNFNKSTLPFSS